MNEHSLPALPCMCATLRRASRALTNAYEKELRPLGLSASQFTILQVLSRGGELNQGELGAILAMDSTTLTRTLATMSGNGWITRRIGKDRRERRFRLTRPGETLLQRALPRWERAQAGVRSALGDRGWNDALSSIYEVTRAVTN